MRILLFGRSGQLGHELVGPLRCLGDLAAVGREIAFEDRDALAEAVRGARPDVIVNAVAYNDVDRAEEHPEEALAVNRDAVATLGELAAAQQAALIHLSTDYVFDGTATAPYREDDAPNPVNRYGESKLAGERALMELQAPAVVFRTCWVYSLRRRSFITTMLRLAASRETLSIAADQHGSPTWCRDLATAIALVIRGWGSDPHGGARDARGVYHLAGGGVASRYEWCQEAFAQAPMQLAVKELQAVDSDFFPTKARRPNYTPLASDGVRERFGVALPDWRDAVGRAMADLPREGS